MGERVDDTALDTLFRQARTYAKWQARPVPDQLLRDLYELVKWGPTSANGSPARFVFLRSTEAKERLRPALTPRNVEKTMTAPVTVIVGYDYGSTSNSRSSLLTIPPSPSCFTRIPSLSR